MEMRKLPKRNDYACKDKILCKKRIKQEADALQARDPQLAATINSLHARRKGTKVHYETVHVSEVQPIIRGK